MLNATPATPATPATAARASFEAARANHRTLADEWANLPDDTDPAVAEELRMRVLALSDVAYEARIAAYVAERAEAVPEAPLVAAPVAALTPLAAAVQAAHVVRSELARRILAALTPDDVQVTITDYHDGFVPNSYTFAVFGDCTTTVITAAGATVTKGQYNRRRSHGIGTRVVVTIARPEQKRGRLA